MIYLASPYTHPDPFVREARYLAAMKKTIEYLKEGKWVYSPIVHCHELAKMMGMDTSFASWRQYNFHMLSMASQFHVLMLDGWEESIGVLGETNYWRALSLDREITMVQP